MGTPDLIPSHGRDSTGSWLLRLRLAANPAKHDGSQTTIVQLGELGSGEVEGALATHWKVATIPCCIFSSLKFCSIAPALRCSLLPLRASPSPRSSLNPLDLLPGSCNWLSVPPALGLPGRNYRGSPFEGIAVDSALVRVESSSGIEGL